MPPEFFILAFIVDMALGEPAFMPHPVEAVGYAVSRMERFFTGFARSASAQRLAGTAMAATVASVAFLLVFLAIRMSYEFFGAWGGGAVTVYLAYTTISVRGLADAALAVRRPLADADLHGARGALSMVVGRDTAGLDAREVARGAIETVAENSSDGVVAPLFYMALGGVPLAMAYKAVNTMDSMVGYRSEKHLYFGWAPARLDDLANFIPARLTAVFIVAASAALEALHPDRFSAKGAWRIFVRDRKNHTSPNSGCPEAAVAGSLGVRLGGESRYFGKTSAKPFIGEPERDLGPETIADSVVLLYAASLLSFGVMALLSYLVTL